MFKLNSIKEKISHSISGTYNDKRYAPLINLGASVLAFGEGTVEAITGNYEAALESYVASGAHLLIIGASYLPKYTLIGPDSDISGLKANNVGIIGNAASLGASLAFETSSKKSIKSVSLNALPIINVIQIGTNACELGK